MEMAKTVLLSFFRNGNLWKKSATLWKTAYDMLKNDNRFLPDKLFWRVLSDGAQCLEHEYDLAVAYLEGAAAYFVADHVKAKKKAAFIHIDYENFFGKTFTGTVRPLCVKLFKRRWYMLVLVENGEKRKFSLDRIKDLTLLDTTFKYPSRFKPSDHFEHFYGITAWDDAKPQEIVIRAYKESPGYLRSLPLHPSQREIKKTDEYTDFSMRLTPTFDFEQELLLHRDQIEVLQPQSLRDEMAKLVNRMTNLYHDKV